MKTQNHINQKITLSNLFLMLLLATLCGNAFASTTWYVSGGSGSDSNNCQSPTTACKTIGHAISLASSGDTVMVAAATYTENLAIGINLNVIGAGARTTIIDGNGANIVIDIYNSSLVTLSNITIRNGRHAFGAGIDNQNGSLTINNSTISGNTSNCKPPICSAYGGGIYNGGVLTINNSTIVGNTVSGWINPGQGGGIYNAHVALINNSTLMEMGQGRAAASTA